MQSAMNAKFNPYGMYPQHAHSSHNHQVNYTWLKISNLSKQSAKTIILFMYSLYALLGIVLLSYFSRIIELFIYSSSLLLCMTRFNVGKKLVIQESHEKFKKVVADELFFALYLLSV